MPRGKKRAANGNGHKPLSYKVGKREGGSVKFSGGTGEVPAAVSRTLDKFGFGHRSGLEWRDETLPRGEDSYNELEQLARSVDVQIHARPPRTKRGGVVYVVTVGEGEKVQGKNLTEALIKAHRSWNRGGRKVGGMDMEKAISGAISK